MKGPDPSEFVIEDDDSLPSRAATPKPPAKDGSDETTVDRAQAANENAPADKDAGSGEKAAEAKAPEELPQDVRLKLRKLEKLESRYHGELAQERELLVTALFDHAQISYAHIASPIPESRQSNPSRQLSVKIHPSLR